MTATPGLAALQPGEGVYLYHWRFASGEEFGLFRHAEDAEAMAAEHAGEGLSEVLSMAVLGRPQVAAAQEPHAAAELAETVTVAGVPYSDYPSLAAAMQAEIDRERTTRLHMAGERDEARSDLARMGHLAGEVLDAFKGSPARVTAWRERADAITGRHAAKAAIAAPQPAPGLPHRHPFTARDCECPPDCECWRAGLTS